MAKAKTADISSSFILRSICAVILLCSFSSGIALYFFRIDLLELLPKIHFCFFRILTGFDCPFCGSTRAFLALGQLKLMKAISFNPLAPILMVIMIIYLSAKKMPLWLQHKSLAYLFLCLVVLSWVAQLAGFRFS